MDLGLKGKAALVVFLASERSGCITGAAIRIDGGWYKGVM